MLVNRKLRSDKQFRSFKIIPLSQLKFDSLTMKKLKGGAYREEQNIVVDYRTPFYAVPNDSKHRIEISSRITGVKHLKPISRAEIVERCYDQVVKTSIKDKDYIEGENKFMAYRHSPRSVKLKYSDIFEKTVVPYFTNAQREFSEEGKAAIQQGLIDGEKHLRTIIPAHSLRPLDFETAMDSLPATTNGGAPFFVTGKLVGKDDNGKEIVLEDNRTRYLKLAKQIYETGQYDPNMHAYGSIGRGQETNDDKKLDGLVVSKQRRPGAEGHALTIIGAMLRPYYEARKKFSTRAALVSQSAVDRVISESGSRGDHTVSGDGSAFDTHLIPGVLREIGQIIMRCFKLDKKQERLFSLYFQHVTEAPLITPLGLMIGEHGMPSGTTITNEGDSDYNEVLTYAVNYLHKTKELGLKFEMITNQGDDAVMKLYGSKNLSVEEIGEGLSESYSILLQDVNPKKNRISKDTCEYLKRLHRRGQLESYRSYIGTCIGMCNMERAKDGKWPMYSARWLMQLANHYETLPGFSEMMSFCANGDTEYGLGLKLKGGPKAIFQMAGGESTVIKRLGLQSYSTHLALDTSEQEAKLDSTLSSVRGVEAHKRNTGKHEVKFS